MGTTNAKDLVLKTNNQDRVVVDKTSGSFRIMSLQGSGSALIQANANGELIRVPPGGPGDVISGNGNPVNITTLINVNSISGWGTSGSSVTLTNPNANVGIGVTNPTCKLEVKDRKSVV